jgi:hypothetical protein
MLDGLVRSVDEVVGRDVGLMPDSEIRETIIALRREVDRAEAFAARLVAVAHHRTIPAGDGAASTPAWLQWQTGQRVSEAKAVLAAGLACESLPLTAKAWAQGEISSSAARTIVRGRRDGFDDVYAEIEETLVDYAAGADFRGLDAMIRHYQTRADALDDRDPSDLNGLHHSRVGNRWALKADFDELAGKTIDQAIEAATDPPSDDDTRAPAKRRADAMARVARFFLDHANLPMQAGEVPHLSFVVACDTARTGSPTTPFESALSPIDIGRLLCEANISRIVVGPDGVPLDVGRAMRNPSKALRRAVTVRDGGCRFSGCDRRPSWCEVHDIEPWMSGGETKLDNLVLLCDHHHHVVHKPGWVATFDGLTFTVTNPDGRVVGSTRARR